jgi:hypothetical protein
MTLPLVEMRRDIDAVHQLLERPDLVPPAHRELMLVYEHARCSVFVGALPTTRGSASFAGVALCFYNPTTDRGELLEVEKERVVAGVLAICMILARAAPLAKPCADQIALLARWVASVATTPVAVTTRILVSTIGEPRPLPLAPEQPAAAVPVASVPLAAPVVATAASDDDVVVVPAAASRTTAQKRKRDDESTASTTSPKISDDDDESDECAICLANKPDCRLLPCAHKSVCKACVGQLFNAPGERAGQCPRCTTTATQVLTDDGQLKEKRDYIAPALVRPAFTFTQNRPPSPRPHVPQQAHSRDHMPTCPCMACERSRSTHNNAALRYSPSCNCSTCLRERVVARGSLLDWRGGPSSTSMNG